MSELRSNSSSEMFESRNEAPSLTPNTRVDFHKSNLQSAEKGREFARAARAAIDAQLSRERPSQPIPQHEVAEVGMHIADFRLWELELTEGETETARTFRKTAAEFEKRAQQAEFVQWENQFQQSSEAELAQKSADISYELTDSRN